MLTIFTTHNIIIFLGTVLTFWIFQNKKLRDGVTQWYLDRKLKGKIKLEDHHVFNVIDNVQFKAKNVKYDDEIKDMVFHFYVETFIKYMLNYTNKLLDKENDVDFIELKRLISSEIYNTLSDIDIELKNKINMPDKLQDQFEKFSSYLSVHHSEEIDNVLKQALNKDSLLEHTFNTVASNLSWYLFYTVAMFDNFNGAFSSLKESDVFKY